MQRLHMVALDIAVPTLSIELAEVEVAGLATQGSSLCAHAVDLPLPKLRIPLPIRVPAEEVPALDFALVLIADIAREIRWLTLGHGVPYRFGQAVHHVRLRNEPGDDLLIPSSAVGRPTRIAG